jgi:hypothetical protein
LVVVAEPFDDDSPTEAPQVPIVAPQEPTAVPQEPTAEGEAGEAGESAEEGEPAEGEPAEEGTVGPDLAVAVVEVFPEEPVQQAAFAYNVYATNLGTTHTGDFSLVVLIVDVVRGTRYPDTSQDRTGLDPGEQTLVESYDNRMVNCPGPHELRVEFTVPEGDADPSNNVFVHPFTVQPNPGGLRCD